MCYEVMNIRALEPSFVGGSRSDQMSGSKNFLKTNFSYQKSVFFNKKDAQNEVK